MDTQFAQEAKATAAPEASTAAPAKNSGRQRDLRLDILKGIGIILMVMGHANAPGRSFIYLFHMAVFFIASGWLYREDAAKSGAGIWRFVRRRILSLYVPYVLTETIYSALNNVFLQLHFYSSGMLKEQLPWGGMLMTFPGKTLSAADVLGRFLGALHFQWGAELGAAMWFLQVLFLLSILYILIDALIRLVLRFIPGSRDFWRDILMGLAAIGLLAAGFAMSHTRGSYFGFDKTFSYFCLFYLGNMLRKYDRLTALPAVLIKAACGLVLLLLLQGHGSIELSANSYSSPLFLIAASAAGWYLLYGVSTLIEKLPALARPFIAAGENTLAVVILHFLVFKVVNTIVVLVYGLPADYAAAFPILIDKGAWWLLYTAAGVTIPVLLNIGKKHLIRKLPGQRADA